METDDIFRPLSLFSRGIVSACQIRVIRTNVKIFIHHVFWKFCALTNFGSYQQPYLRFILEGKSTAVLIPDFFKGQKTLDMKDSS